MHQSTGRRRAAVTAEEQDVYTGWRKVLIWTGRAGTVKGVKRRTHRRERREATAEIRRDLEG